MSTDTSDEDAAAVAEEYLDSELSDGLPAVPPTPARIAAMIEGMGRPPGTVIGTLPPGDGEATVDHVAANAVLAGCRPEYGPVVLAAVRAMTREEFGLYGVACSTKGAAPLAIVNGPIRHRVGMNSGGNVFGHGNRANATIGRALRLVLQNVAQAAPGVLDAATLGHPGKYAYCVAEDEEGSPWEPLHADRGLAAGDSAVTVLGCEAPRQVGVQPSSGAALLGAVAHTLASAETCGGASGLGGDRNAPHLVVFAREHRDVLAAESWTRAAIAEYLVEHAVAPAALVRTVTGIPDAEPVRAISSAGDVLVVAAGGTAGRFSAVCPGWTWQSRPATARVGG